MKLRTFCLGFVSLVCFGLLRVSCVGGDGRGFSAASAWNAAHHHSESSRRRQLTEIQG